MGVQKSRFWRFPCIKCQIWLVHSKKHTPKPSQTRTWPYIHKTWTFKMGRVELKITLQLVESAYEAKIAWEPWGSKSPGFDVFHASKAKYGLFDPKSIPQNLLKQELGLISTKPGLLKWGKLNSKAPYNSRNEHMKL